MLEKIIRNILEDAGIEPDSRLLISPNLNRMYRLTWVEGTPFIICGGEVDIEGEIVHAFTATLFLGTYEEQPVRVRQAFLNINHTAKHGVKIVEKKEDRSICVTTSIEVYNLSKDFLLRVIAEVSEVAFKALSEMSHPSNLNVCLN